MRASRKSFQSKLKINFKNGCKCKQAHLLEARSTCLEYVRFHAVRRVVVCSQVLAQLELSALVEFLM